MFWVSVLVLQRWLSRSYVCIFCYHFLCSRHIPQLAERVWVDSRKNVMWYLRNCWEQLHLVYLLYCKSPSTKTASIHSGDLKRPISTSGWLLCYYLQSKLCHFLNILPELIPIPVNAYSCGLISCKIFLTIRGSVSQAYSHLARPWW